MQITEKGIWVGREVPHGTDEGLAKAIADYFHRMKAENVLDLGCGNGYYTRYLNSKGIPCIGVDGNPSTKEFDPDLWIADLSEKQELGRYDYVLSLEVGEHIPRQYMHNFLYNLDHHNKRGMVLSWSIPEFGGEGHVNPLEEKEIKFIIHSLGYTNNHSVENELRFSCANYPTPCWWFRHTLMVFDRL